MSLISEVWVVTDKAVLKDPNSPLFVGFECEIEDIRSHEDVDPDVIDVHKDGSLRNNGHEYVSVPLTVRESLEAFSKLHDSLVLGDEPFTERTSIHIHANCLNLHIEEVKNILLLYALYEEAFFAMCSKSRRNNIHCVALTETFLPSLYSRSLDALISRWHKYTALNIKPLAKYGTIEFRHMHGHDDLDLFASWLTAIDNLFKAKATNVFDIVKDESKILETFTRIFGHTNLKYTDIRASMQNSIIDIKLLG